MTDPLSQIDHLASAGRSPWHRASALAKLLLAAELVLLAVLAPSLSPSLGLLAVLYASAWALALSGRVPWRLLLAASGYPVLFVLLFLVARWDGTLRTPVRLLLPPLTATLVAVWLVTTTPYPDLFAPLSRVLPRSVGDGLFLTYRALFELTRRTDGMWRALRLRGGARGPLSGRLAVAGEGLGTLVLHGFERSQRLYATMQLRGHTGRICGCRHFAEGTRYDLLAGAAGLAVAVGAALAWRMP
ncbi:MAG TPA: CbiQ family ECF transporter T component [Terriglobales bacterium]|nr:CbiQ family ECF transporter T component [Terriglobales bacterium]